MRYRKIPDETIRRLPVYLRGLMALLQESETKINSGKLAEAVGVNAWQIRKDFSHFGGFGTPGVGYDIKKLIKQINKILRLDIGHKAALVGVGNLGSAVLAHPGFEIYGFSIVAAFDVNPRKIGKKNENVTIEDVSNIKTLRRRKITIGIIATPREAAQETADALVKAGVRGILSFSPCRINTPKKVKVVPIDIAMDLACMPYYMPRR